MTREELIEFIKDSLKITVDYHSGNDWDTKSITVKLFLYGEEIDSSTDYIYREDIL